MKTKFKVGDKVLLNKPKCPNNNILFWGVEMERYIGDVFEVARVDADNKIYYCEGEYAGYWFHESWLTKVEGRIIEEEPRAKEENQIDWEARRWDLYKIFLGHHLDYSIGEALNAADRCIEIYKQTLK